jgi:hypothetical protein
MNASPKHGRSSDVCVSSSSDVFYINCDLPVRLGSIVIESFILVAEITASCDPCYGIEPMESDNYA